NFGTKPKNKIDLFFLTTSVVPKLAKINPEKAVPVTGIAIIGAGLMGQGIAQICADRGSKFFLLILTLKLLRQAKKKSMKGWNLWLRKDAGPRSEKIK
ncbi:3-hydroxyacyl-CoA dehydrogenase NAD-binding domain-containing protein, partial [Dehalococcoidia bacterium]|nr:3-hydroxyacyl-CoA dehydrogenase NAD-binding domain-containing protein [Dehalococcoidia bacterium]